MDRRTRARELAVQSLYQLDVQGPSLFEFIGDFFSENSRDELVRQLAWEWTSKTWEHLEQCDALITASTKRWRLSRLSGVDRSILRLSVYQLKFCSDIPPRVVINEAIELAKKFSTAQSPAFVNGVLDNVLRRLEAEDHN